MYRFHYKYSTCVGGYVNLTELNRKETVKFQTSVTYHNDCLLIKSLRLYKSTLHIPPVTENLNLYLGCGWTVSLSEDSYKRQPGSLKLRATSQKTLFTFMLTLI